LIPFCTKNEFFFWAEYFCCLLFPSANFAYLFLSVVYMAHSDIPLAIGAPLSNSKGGVVKKKRAPKARVGYARDADDEQNESAPPAPPATSVSSLIPPKTTTSSSIGSTSVSKLGMNSDDLPKSVLEEISAAEMLDKRLREEAEAREVAEAIEAVAKAEAEAKAKEEAEAKAIAKAKAEAEAHQQEVQSHQQAPSPVSLFAGKAKSWLMGGSEAAVSTSITPAVTVVGAASRAEVVKPSVGASLSSSSLEAPISTSTPISLLPSSQVTNKEAAPMTLASSVISSVTTAAVKGAEQEKSNVAVITAASTKPSVTTTTTVEKVSLTEELDSILGVFVQAMESKCSSIENDHELVTELEVKMANITRSRAETLQGLHAFEAKQIALAEAEDYEGAEALTSVVEEHKVKAAQLLEELQQAEVQLKGVCFKSILFCYGLFVVVVAAAGCTMCC
jgi:hypothetical protein